jgi:hypothetical protein
MVGCMTATTSVVSYVKPRLTTACGWPPSSQQTRKSAPSRLVFRSRLRRACLVEFAWPAHLRRTRHIGDFRAWKDHDAYQRTLERLLRDLRVETT